MRIKLFLSIALLLVFHIVYAQQNVDFTKQTQVTPPSPVTYQMSKYGGINTSLISGSPNISIPLLNFQCKTISVPIGLRYTSSGIKVDQIASRVGLGWDYEAGGVISRIIYDVPDESSIQIATIPTNLTEPSDEAWNFYNQASSNSNIDTQPDVYNFSFGGYSGKFIIVNGSVKQIVKSDLRIEKNQENFDFKVTTPDGNKYYFGGEGATEFSNSENSCDIHRPSFPATAWHLKKIAAYTGETVNFLYQQHNCSYPLGINETMTRFRLLEQANPCPANNNPFPPQIDDQICISRLKTYYCLLSEINSTVNGLIKFSYINRNDLVGEYLISKIRYFSSQDSSSLNNYVSFNYTYSNSSNTIQGASNNFMDPECIYRAFLADVKEYSSSDKLIKTHSFEYDNINNLPPRLSFSQDIFGYYNGKFNAYLIPKQPIDVVNFPLGLADRSFDFNYSKNGLLTKVNYPTGGSDEIIYEPNSTYEDVVIAAPSINISTYGTGSGSRSVQTHTSSAFTPLISQTIKLTGYCNFSGQQPDNLYTYHYAMAEVFDQTTNQTIFSKKLEVDAEVNEDVILEANHTYILILKPYGIEVLASIDLKYKNQQNSTGMQNVDAPGIRIQKSITKTSLTDIGTIKKYYYHTPESNFINSSGLKNYNPEFHEIIEVGAPCVFGNLGATPVFGIFDGLYSYAINTQYLQQTPVQYQWVAESFGENFDNGGVAHNFLIYSDTPGEVLYGKRITGAPLSNYGIMNGLETKNISYAKKNNSLIKTKIIETKYRESAYHDFAQNGVEQPVYAYVVRRNYADIRGHSPHNAEDMKTFYALRYKIMGSWFYADTIKTTILDANGNNPVVNLSIYKYDNVLHAQPTSIISLASTEKSHVIDYLYPYDFTTLITDISSQQISGLQSLVYSNRISTPVQTLEKVNGVEVNRLRIDYRDWGANLVMPEFYKVGNSGSTLENRVTFDAYNPLNGNLISQSQSGGSKTTYLYSYMGQYPIAEIKNANYVTVENLLGGAVQVSNFSNSNPTDADVNAFLATLRNSLPAAQITTYTYKPLVGMTSSTDAKRMTTYYEYDEFQRLKNIKDQNGNIIKSYDYHYKP